MAWWLSSKLKEAEQFLQQIDQHAAESLGKPEKQRSTAHQDISKEINGALPKKPKHPSDYLLAKETTSFRQGPPGNKSDANFQPSFSRPKGLGKFDYGQKEFNTTTRPEANDPKAQSKKQPSSVSRSMESFENVGRDDWTELLASPNLNLVSSPALASSVGSSDSGGSSSIRGVSSRATLNKDRNGGHLQQGVEFPERKFSLFNQSRQVSSQASHKKVLAHSSDIDVLNSELATSPRNFRDNTLIRQLELDVNFNQRIDRHLEEAAVRDASSTTANGLGMNAQITDANDPESITGSVLASKDGTFSMLGSSLDYRRDHERTKEVPELMKNDMFETVRKDGPVETTQQDIDNQRQRKDLQFVREDSPGLALECVEFSADKTAKVDSANENGHDSIQMVGQFANMEEPRACLEESPGRGKNELKEKIITNRNSSSENGVNAELVMGKHNLASEERGSLGLPSDVKQVKGPEADNGNILITTQRSAAFSESDSEGYESGTETESGLESESEDEEIERRKSVHKRRIAKRKEIAAAKAAAAEAAINEREEFVRKLEKEKVTLECILAEREEQQGREAAELRLSTTELLQALELEKQYHSSTRMKALAKESQLENQNAELAKSLGAVQWELEEQIAEVLKIRSMVEAKDVIKAELERRLTKFHHELWGGQQNEEGKLTGVAQTEDYSFEEEQAGLWRKIEQSQIQVKELERKLGDLKDSRRVPTQTEMELETHLTQLTDHLIQKQAQVEGLSTEKATLAFRLEAVSNTLQEERVRALSRASRIKMGISKNSDWSSLDVDMEYGMTRPYNFRNKSFSDDVEESTASVGKIGSLPFSPVIRQLDAVFSVGMLYLRRHRWAQVFASAYILGLHLWVMFIFIMHSKHSQTRSVHT